MVFVEKEKPQKLKKELWNQGQNEQQTQPTYDAVSELRPHWWEVTTMTTIYIRTLVDTNILQVYFRLIVD